MTVADIALDISLNVETQNREMEIAVSRTGHDVSMTIEKSATPVPEYTGDYSVAPRFYYGKTLETKGYRMTDNVTVEAIASYAVVNDAGGKTVTIGSL